MAKALAATCLAGVVTVEGVPVPGAVLLSEGVAESSGYAIFDEDKVYYVAKTSPDLKTTLTEQTSIVTKICQVLSSHDSAFSNANAATIAQIVAANAILITLKDTLK